METKTCIQCGRKHSTRNGKGYLLNRCQKCNDKNRKNPRWIKPHIRVVARNGGKPLVCSRCGFVAADKGQIDIDHIDGKHNNNSIENLQFLCANCHRLKTMRPDLFVQGNITVTLLKGI